MDDEIVVLGESQGEVVDLVDQFQRPVQGMLNPQMFLSPTSLEKPINIEEKEEDRPTISSLFGEDAKTKCPICLERWSSLGSHRLSALRCGHLFGLACIKEWVNRSKNTTRKASCPICHKTIFSNDIYPLFVGDVYAIDSAELDLANERTKRFRKENEKLKKQVSDLKKQLSSRDRRIQVLGQESEMLKKEALNELIKKDPSLMYPSTTGRNPTPKPSPPVSISPRTPPIEPRVSPSPLSPSLRKLGDLLGPSSTPPLKKKKGNPTKHTQAPPVITSNMHYHNFVQTTCIKIKNGRTSEFLDKESVVVSNGSESNNGLLKISLIDPSIQQQIWNHKQPIRDLKSKGDLNMLLCASFDNFSTVIDCHSMNTIMKLPVGTGSLSCEWSHSDPNICYFGCWNNLVKVFDLRKPAEILHVISNGIQGQPQCHSLNCFDRGQLGEAASGVKDILLGGNTMGAGVYSFSDGEVSSSSYQKLTSVTGRCVSTRILPHSRTCLISYGRTIEYSKPSHYVFSLDVTEPRNLKLNCNRILYGNGVSSSLFRSEIMNTQGRNSLQISISTDGDHVSIWDVENGSILQRIKQPGNNEVAINHSEEGDGAPRRLSICSPTMFSLWG